MYSATVASPFFFFSLPILIGHRLDVYHASTHDMALVHANLECRSEMCSTQLTQNTGRKNSPSAHHRTTLSGYIFTTKACINNRKKNLLNSSVSSTCPHNMMNFSPLAAEIGWQVWGTPADFNNFAQRRSTKLHNVWPSPGLEHHIYNFGGSCHLTEFCQVQNSLHIEVLHSPIFASLLHGT